MGTLLSLFTHAPMVIFNEIYLMSILYWHYKWSSLINALTTAGDFIWWMLLIDGGVLIPEKIAPLVVGYIMWVYANYLIYDANYFIIDAGQTGVLEQVYLTPYPFCAFKLINRFVAAAVFSRVAHSGPCLRPDFLPHFYPRQLCRRTCIYSHTARNRRLCIDFVAGHWAHI